MSANKTIKDTVYDYITKGILEGTLRPDEKINELQLSKELGVSRTPVREALFSMASEGILINLPHKGFFIKPLPGERVAELYEIIGCLDGLAASLACGHISEQVLSDMDFYVESMDLAIRMGNYAMYYQQQEVFHKLYTEQCGNQLLIDDLADYKRKLIKRSYDIVDPALQKKILLQNNKEHREIVRLFRDNKADSLRSLLEKTHWSKEKAEYASLV